MDCWKEATGEEGENWRKEEGERRKEIEEMEVVLVRTRRNKKRRGGEGREQAESITKEREKMSQPANSSPLPFFSFIPVHSSLFAHILEF